jgi:fructose-bisphosphate aldolase class I
MKRACPSSSTEKTATPNPHFRCHGGSHLTGAQKKALRDTANALATPKKGITACDESAGTIGKRFESCGVENTVENRRCYRQMLFESPCVADLLCGAILDPETLTQTSSVSGKPFPEVLSGLGIVPGVKPHLKVYALPGFDGETVMQGLDSLAVRCNQYYSEGARFTKWRSPLEIDLAAGRPTRIVMEENMRDLARFALISQAEGLVPLVEPDVVMVGTHDLEAAVAINTEILGILFAHLREIGVYLEGIILKTNMVLPGKNCPKSYTAEEIGLANVETLRRTLPTAVPGVNYLSGGQALGNAVNNLQAINDAKGAKDVWNLSFSWSAAIQMPLFELIKEGKGGLDEQGIQKLSDAYVASLHRATRVLK